MLIATGQVLPEQVQDNATVGELALDGSVRPIKSALAMAMASAERVAAFVRMRVGSGLGVGLRSVERQESAMTSHEPPFPSSRQSERRAELSTSRKRKRRTVRSRKKARRLRFRLVVPLVVPIVRSSFRLPARSFRFSRRLRVRFIDSSLTLPALLRWPGGRTPPLSDLVLPRRNSRRVSNYEPGPSGMRASLRAGSVSNGVLNCIQGNPVTYASGSSIPLAHPVH